MKFHFRQYILFWNFIEFFKNYLPYYFPVLQRRLKMDRRQIRRFFGFWKWTEDKYEDLLIQKFFEDFRRLQILWISSKIFEEFAFIEDLRRISELTKILRICLWSIFRNQRIYVFVFGPFSIFVATLHWIKKPNGQCVFWRGLI